MRIFSTIFLSITCLLFSLNAYCQESSILTKNTSGAYSFEKVFDAPGKSKTEIFNSIKSWVIKNIKSQSNTNYFDEANQNISTTPVFLVSFDGTVNFKLNLEIKDGKYRLTANSFVYQNKDGLQRSLGDFSGTGYYKKIKIKLIEDADTAFKNILDSINNAVTSKSDW
jgi:hypothetical protein